MKISKAALTASTLALAACQQDKNPDVAVTNDLSASNIIVDNGSATLTNSAVNSVDSAFVTDAIKGDNGEVAIGNLAVTKAASQQAKDFGRMLARDHGEHKQKLVALASSAGIASTEEATDEAKNNLETLKRLKGAEFDKEFKRMMVEDHTKDIAKYEKQASSGDPETSALAKETLPTLRKHLAAAKSL